MPAVEVNTPDKLEYNFYPASGCFSFKVRAANDAHIALTTEPHESDPMFEVFLGGWKNTKSVIRKNRTKPDLVEVDTPDILNAGEFRGFWIRWYDNVLTVGREGEVAAFLSWENLENVPIRYVGICTGWGASGTWLVDNDTPTADGFSSGGGCGPGCWVPAADGVVPPGAMPGGVDGTDQLYVARATHEGALIPGKLHPSHGVTYIAWGGGEHGHNQYEVLCQAGGKWVPVSGGGSIPPNALPAGETETGEPLFIGRANHDGAVVVGKVQPSHGCCYIPYSGEELAYSDYEIFVTN